MLTQDPKAMPLEDESIEFHQAPFEMILSEVHELLVNNPDLPVVMGQGEGENINFEMIPEQLRVQIRDDLESAMDYWAPAEKTVHVRKEA